jgi:hypothetical protein
VSTARKAVAILARVSLGAAKFPLDFPLARAVRGVAVLLLSARAATLLLSLFRRGLRGGGTGADGGRVAVLDGVGAHYVMRESDWRVCVVAGGSLTLVFVAWRFLRRVTVVQLWNVSTLRGGPGFVLGGATLRGGAGSSCGGRGLSTLRSGAGAAG